MFNIIVTLAFSAVFTTVNSASSRPEIVDDILPEFKQQGQVGYLNCSVINLVAPAVLQWVKVNTTSGNPLLISDDENIKITDNHEGQRKYEVVKTSRNNRDKYQLVIRWLTEVDSGDYKCQIYLPNQNYLEWPSKIGHLTVQIAPTIKADSPASITVQEGDNITLICEANGIPAPNITWRRGDGFPLPGGGFQHRGGIFNVRSINAADRGQFICIADNNVRPPANYIVQLEVRFGPYTKAVQDTVGQAQNRRFNAILDCLVAAYPRAEVIWYKENKATKEKEQIQDNDKYALNQQDDQRLKADERWYTLEIKNVQGNDYGTYYCSGRNPFGSSEAKFVLFECPIGHIVNEANSDCIPCPEGKYGVQCTETCHCTTNERCDNVAGCVIPAKSTILSTSSQFTTQPKSKANKIYENLPYIGIIGSLVLVIFILVVFVCVREKRREENNSNNQEKPAQGQKNEMQTHNSVYEYEEIDEQFIQDVLSVEEKFCPNQKFSDESILENDLQSGYLNPYQPVVPEVDKRKYDSLHGVQDNSSGSEGDTRSSGYLHPNLPLSPTLISSDRDYSKLRNRSEQQPVQNKHVLHQVLDLGDDSSINGERDKNEGATDSSSDYLNPYQPIITSKADIHEYKTIHEVEDNSHDYEINI